MEGEMDKIIDALIQAEKKLKLSAVQS